LILVIEDPLVFKGSSNEISYTISEFLYEFNTYNTFPEMAILIRIEVQFIGSFDGN